MDWRVSPPIHSESLKVGLLTLLALQGFYLLFSEFLASAGRSASSSLRRLRLGLRALNNGRLLAPGALFHRSLSLPRRGRSPLLICLSGFALLCGGGGSLLISRGSFPLLGSPLLIRLRSFTLLSSRRSTVLSSFRRLATGGGLFCLSRLTTSGGFFGLRRLRCFTLGRSPLGGARIDGHARFRRSLPSILTRTHRLVRLNGRIRIRNRSRLIWFRDPGGSLITGIRSRRDKPSLAAIRHGMFARVFCAGFDRCRHGSRGRDGPALVLTFASKRRRSGRNSCRLSAGHHPGSDRSDRAALVLALADQWGRCAGRRFFSRSRLYKSAVGSGGFTRIHAGIRARRRLAGLHEAACDSRCSTRTPAALAPGLGRPAGPFSRTRAFIGT